MTRIRTLALSAATIAAIGSVAACSSSAGGGQHRSAAPSPIPTTATVTTTAAAGTATGDGNGATTKGATSRAGGGSATSPCVESQLRANVGGDDISGVNRHVLRVTFTNTSGSSCTLTGYPGAAIEDGSNKQVRQAKRVAGGPIGGTIERPRTLTLPSGAVAYAYLEGASTREQGAAQAGCDGAKYPRILITPPNTDTPVPFTIGWPQCYSFQIHPVRID